MSNDPSKQVGFEVDEQAYEMAKEKLDYGEMSEILREAIHEVAFGSRTTEQQRVKDRLKELREKKRKKQREIRDAQQEVDEIERKIERCEDRLDELQEQDGEFDGALELLESQLEEGSRVFVGHGQVEQAAELGKCTQEEVIQTLKQRNPDLPDEAFRRPKPDEPSNWDAAVPPATTKI